MTIVTDRGETEVIETTPSHPFYSADRRDYIPAAQLRLDERLRTADDPPGHASARVKSLVPRAPPQGEPGFRVYNLEVHGLHTYHVGDAGVLVHNTCSPLRKNMNKAGNWGKAGEQAAHVFAKGNFRNRAKKVRDAIADSKRILERNLGKGAIDNAHNGFFTKVRGHNGTHTDDYFLDAHRRIESAERRGPASVKQELQKLKNDILNGMYK